jgi:hypothetical protein
VTQAEAAPKGPAAAPTATPTPPAGSRRACASDAECPDETICEASVCRRIQHRVNVFYLYYQDGTFREVLGLYWNKRGPSGYTVLFPFYWNYFGPRERSRIVAPFYWHFEDDVARRSTTVIVPGLPVSWTRQPGARSFAVWPLFYASSRFGWAAPLLGSFRIADPDHGKSFGAMAFLYWSKRTPRSAFDLGVPVFVSVRSPASAFTFALPLTLYWRTGPSWFFSAFPLWWAAGNTQTRWRFHMLVPIFFARSGEHGRSFTLITPLGGYSRDDDARSKTLTVWPVLSFFRRDPVRSLDIVTPFYIRHRDHEADANTRLLALLLYLRDDPGGSTSIVFPIFWRFKDAATQSTGTVVFPFAYHRSGPNGSATYAGIFPLWFFHRRLADGGASTGVFPLVFSGHRGDASHLVVFPLFWHFASARSSVTVLPLFYSTRNAGGAHAGIPPLLFWGHDRTGKSYVIQFPLLWRFADARARTSTTVTVVGFWGASPAGWRLGVGPLLPIVWAAGGGPRRHLVVFPVLWHFADDRRDESSTLVTLYFHRRRGGETTDALFPLLYYRRGARTPGDDQTSFTLFPFIHYRRDASTRLWITPLAAAASGPLRAAGFVGPYLWYRGPKFEARGIPLLYADVFRRDTRERTRQFGPFVALDSPAKSSRVLLPLFGFYRDAHETDTFILPSYFRQRRDDGYAVDTFLPLFWHSRWQDHRATVIGPWYQRQAPLVYNTGLVPLYFWAKSADRTLLVLPLLLTFHRRDFRSASTVTWVGPLFRTVTPQSSRTVVFPLWWSLANRADPERGLRNPGGYRILLPVYFHFASAVTGSRWSLLPPLYWSTHGGERTRALLPIAWYSRNDTDHVGTEAILPLFYTAHGPNRFTLFTLLAGISRGGTTHRWYVGPLFVSNSAEGSIRALFPLYYSELDRGSESRTRFFLPLLHFSRTQPRRSISTWAALFWRRTDITSATTVVVPLFYDIQDYRQKRTTILVPLFLRHANEVTHDSYWVLPVFYRHVNPTDSTHVLFPLIWDFKHPRSRTTLVLPLFAHWTRATYSGTYVFPNIYYRKGFIPGAIGGTPQTEDGTWRLLIPPLFEAAVARPGDFRWEILGGLFGKERIGRNHYLKLFFFSIATQKSTAMQTSWYGQPTRPSRGRPARGVATNIW